MGCEWWRVVLVTTRWIRLFRGGCCTRCNSVDNSNGLNFDVYSVNSGSYHSPVLTNCILSDFEASLKILNNSNCDYSTEDHLDLWQGDCRPAATPAFHSNLDSDASLFSSVQSRRPLGWCCPRLIRRGDAGCGSDGQECGHGSEAHIHFGCGGRWTIQALPVGRITC